MAIEIVRERFNSADEMVRTLGERETYADAGKESVTGSKSFTETKSLDAALSLVHSWQEGADRVEKATADLVGGSGQYVPKRRYAPVPPGRPIMSRVLAGDPECFLERKRRTTRDGRGRVVRIVVNCAASGCVPAHILETRGAAILGAVRALEAKGIRTEVSVVAGIRAMGGGLVFESVVVVKRAEARLNLSSIAFMVAHPSYLRRLVFRHIESHADKRVRDMSNSFYGYPTEYSDRDKADIYVPEAMGTDPTWGSPDRAREWIRDILASQGVTLN